MMDAPITCPSCNARLRVPRGTDPGTALHFTCPRCLALVGVPAAVETVPVPPVEPRRAEALPAEPVPPREEPRDEPAWCPECGYEVSRRWRICPFCSADIHGRRDRPSRRGRLEDDVRVDRAGTTIGVILLAVLSIAGGALLLWLGSGPAQYANMQGVLYLGVGVVVAVALGCGVLAIKGRGRNATSASFAIGASTIVVSVAGLLALLLVSSCCIFFITCGQGVKGPTPPGTPARRGF
jgi:hypothetical protein